MRKKEIYELRTLFERILSDYRNDVGKHPDGSPICRATGIQESVKKGIEICNNDIMKKQPLLNV